jgi:hypothetical protein
MTCHQLARRNDFAQGNQPAGYKTKLIFEGMGASFNGLLQSNGG